MRIVVLSDTHMPRRGRALPRPLVQALERADRIIHLGDFTGAPVVDLLTQYAPLDAVHGNNDSDEIRMRFPAEARLELEGHRVVLVHGHRGGRTALEVARTVRGADIVLFGHSHRAVNVEEAGVVLLNPGSPTDPRWSPYRAYATLDLAPGEIRAAIISLQG